MPKYLHSYIVRFAYSLPLLRKVSWLSLVSFCLGGQVYLWTFLLNWSIDHQRQTIGYIADLSGRLQLLSRLFP